MAADNLIKKLPLDKRADIIFKKMILDCDTKEGIKFSISGAVLDSQVFNISEKAFNIIQAKYSKNLHSNFFFSNRTYQDLRIEHVIPVEFIYRTFLDKLNANLLSKDFILQVIQRSCIALITPDEDILLNKAKFKKTMPAGFDIMKDDPFIRYQKVGIKMHQWPKHF